MAVATVKGDLIRKPFRLYLSFNNEAEGFYLPVMPEKLSFRRKGTGETYAITGFGPVHAIGAPELAEFAFESFFPALSSGFTEKDRMEGAQRADLLLHPYDYIGYLAKWMASKHPVRFIYVGETIDRALSIAVSIESFEYWEEAGQEGDVFYSLALKAYTFYGAKKLPTEPTGVVTAPQRPDERVASDTYRLKAGDTLIKIAREQLGDSGRWGEIQKLNGIADAELKRLQIGSTLKLPKR